jgi:hypothetical protein
MPGLSLEKREKELFIEGKSEIDGVGQAPA